MPALEALRIVIEQAGSRRTCVLGFVLVAMSLVGCAQPAYRYGRIGLSQSLAQTGHLKVQTGGPNERLDRWERAFQYPVRKWHDWFGDGADVIAIKKDTYRRKAAESALAYLDANGLYDVYVDLRVHDPSEQWRRLRENERIHPAFKYTHGALRVGLSNLFPRRVFGADGYNPYTNTLAINSDDPANAVFEAASAKDDHKSSMPGVLAVSRLLPVVPIFQESRIATDSLTYARTNRDLDLERELYPTAYSNIGGSIFSEGYALTSGAGAAPFYVAPVVSLAGKFTGYGIGKLAANQVPDPDPARTASSSKFKMFRY